MDTTYNKLSLWITEFLNADRAFSIEDIDYFDPSIGAQLLPALDIYRRLHEIIRDRQLDLYLVLVYNLRPQIECSSFPHSLCDEDIEDGSFPSICLYKANAKEDIFFEGTVKHTELSNNYRGNIYLWIDPSDADHRIVYIKDIDFFLLNSYGEN